MEEKNNQSVIIISKKLCATYIEFNFRARKIHLGLQQASKTGKIQ